MSNQKHTPGPWQTQGGFVYDNEGRIVCDPHANHVQVSMNRISGREREQNAALIAAAPELLEALNSILSLPCDDEGNRIIPAGYLDDARAAIAKAEGRDK